MNSWRVLVVEDDPDGQELVSRMLRHYHIAIDVAKDAEDALICLANQHYTGVIIDLSLPGMSGWSLLQNIQNIDTTGSLPCVAITAYHSPEVAVEAKRVGFAAYFAKPLEAVEFVQKLRTVFR